MKSWETLVWMVIVLNFGIYQIKRDSWMGITLILLFLRLGIEAIQKWEVEE